LSNDVIVIFGGFVKKQQRKFTEIESLEILNSIFLLMENGKSLRKASLINGITASLALKWISNYDKHEQYARAREDLHDYWAEEILEISDNIANDSIDTQYGEKANNEWIARSRLRVDSRKWLLSKLSPKKYGDRIEDNNSSNTELISGITSLISKLPN
jgi:hypothetical protein